MVQPAESGARDHATTLRRTDSAAGRTRAGCLWHAAVFAFLPSYLSSVQYSGEDQLVANMELGMARWNS
jgi:hypothetical protein